MSDIKRIILTHAHADHAQAANEIKKRTSATSSDHQAKLYAHWIDSAYLAHNPPYHGPPNLTIYEELLAKHDLKIQDVIKKFGKLGATPVDPITVDEELKDGDKIKSLKVIHTPGHTPGHMSLYLEDQRTVFGADVLWNMPNGGGLAIFPSSFTLDEVTAAVSVIRVSQLNFDMLLLGHQDNPLQIHKIPDPRIFPQIFSVTCLPDQVVIRRSIGKSPMAVDLMLNMMIRNRN